MEKYINIYSVLGIISLALFLETLLSKKKRIILFFQYIQVKKLI